MKVAALVTEVFEKPEAQLHIYPKETRRGRAQWAIWVNPDGSGVMFIGNDQIELPKNAPSKR